MATTLAAFANRMATAPKAIKATEAEMVRVAALAVTVAERRAVASATKGTSRLSGVGRAGTKLSVGFDLKGGNKPVAVVRARGPWHLIEGDTRPHVIAPRSRRGGGRKRALAGHGFGPVARVQHPGTKGKHPWQLGLAVGVPAGGQAARLAATAGVLKAFLG